MAAKRFEPLPPAEFLYLTCQVGAERALKAEMARRWPAMHLAFSRPGFLTFKLPPAHGLPADFDPQCVFARSCGFSLGLTLRESLATRAAGVVKLGQRYSFDALHVWQRDMARMGFRGFEPHLTREAVVAAEAIATAWQSVGGPALPVREAQSGERVLDCILIENDQWWLGHHVAAHETCFPGGLRPLSLPADAVSRAYLKMEEALAWSGLPIRPGQTIAEVGCAPGGASQALLVRGLKVIGIDPAVVDSRVLAHPNFTHIRKRGADVRRREFRGVQWLAADMNVAPRYTLDTVEAIVTHEQVNVRGLLITLKLLDWNLAEQVPKFLERVRSWGYRHVLARQLVHNRQEICVAALRKRPSVN